MFPGTKAVNEMKKQYPPGTRVKLLKMDDAQAPPVGTIGTVTGVDDIASLLVDWDKDNETGKKSGLHVVYGEDIVEPYNGVTTICYGRYRYWDKREDAEEFFLDCMRHSEGAEQSRYVQIYLDLKDGLDVCSDGE